MVSRKGNNYLGGHSIEGHATKLGYEKPTYGQIKINLAFRAAGFRENSKAYDKLAETKFRKWASRRGEIGISLKAWKEQELWLEAEFQNAFKNSKRRPEQIAMFWNAEGFSTFTGRRWYSALGCILINGRQIG